MTTSHVLTDLNLADVQQCARWDQFVLDSIRGHHVQFTTWLESYRSYGGVPHVIVAETAGKITGGIGIIALGNRLCRLANCSAGPIVDVGQEAAIPNLLEAAHDWARRAKCVTLQVQPPATTAALPEPFLLPGPLDIRAPWREGPAMPGLAGIEQMLWVPFPQADSVDAWSEGMFARFSSSTRRNLRIAQKAGVDVIEAKDEQLLREGYAIIEQNGVAQGYPTRTWSEFGPTLQQQSKLGHASLFVARHEGRLLGAVYGTWAGRRFTDCMAGTVRTKPDLKIGYFVRYKAMEAAWQRGMIGYDLTADGPPGVKEAKYGFAPIKLVCDPPQHVDFAPLRMTALRFLGDSLKRHRRTLVNLRQSIRSRRSETTAADESPDASVS